MIKVTRLNHVPLFLNSDLIEHIDVTPDTVLTLTNGQILRVQETAEKVIQRIVDFRRRILEPDARTRDEECEAAAPAEILEHSELD